MESTNIWVEIGFSLLIVLPIACLIVWGVLYATEDKHLTKKALKNIDKLKEKYPEVIRARFAYYEARDKANEADFDKKWAYAAVSDVYNSILLSDEEKEEMLVELRKDYRVKNERFEELDEDKRVKEQKLDEWYEKIPKKDVNLIRYLPKDTNVEE